MKVSTALYLSFTKYDLHHLLAGLIYTLWGNVFTNIPTIILGYKSTMKRRT